MKLLHILNELKHSGAEVMLRTAHTHFERNGIESHILSTGNDVGNYAPILEHTGYKIHHIPFRKHAEFFINLRSLLRRENFSAVHIHTERAFIWYVLLAKVAGVPTVIRTFHNVFLFSGYLRWKRTLQRKISANLLRTVHIAISDSVRVFEKERFNNNCILIRNWTDVEKFRPPREDQRAEARRLYHLQAHDFVVVTIGTCSPVKNHLALFSALTKANQCSGQSKFVLLHVGTGPLLEEEEAYVQRHGIEEQCRFVGTLNDVRSCLYAADVFVMTSQWEGLGMAAVEAMSTGLPAILYNVHGLRDLLQDGRGGLLVDPDEGSLVRALLLMREDPQLRKPLAEQAREIALSTYSIEKSVDKLSHFYRNHRPH